MDTNKKKDILIKVEIKDLIRSIAKFYEKPWNKLPKKGSDTNHEKLTDSLHDECELKVQKMLYFLYGQFYKETGKELFKPDFESWKYGPTERNYRNNKKLILKFYECDSGTVINTLLDLMQLSLLELIDKSRDTLPWKNSGSGEYRHNDIRNKMNTTDLKKFFEDSQLFIYN